MQEDRVGSVTSYMRLVRLDPGTYPKLIVLKLILLPNNNTPEAADEIFRVTQPYAAYAGFSHGKMFELINCKLHHQDMK